MANHVSGLPLNYSLPALAAVAKTGQSPHITFRDDVINRFWQVCRAKNPTVTVVNVEQLRRC